MQRDPFVILGVDESVTQNELYEAYKEKRNAYQEKRFAKGEEGAEACRKLQEVEEAYDEASQRLRSRYDVSNAGDLGRVEEAIKAGRLEEAQSLLDGDPNRSGKWHYLQSIVFYKKGWMNESLKQLEFACDLEPDNVKYKESKEKLEKKIAADSNPNKRGYYADDSDGTQRSYSGPAGNGSQPTRGCTPCDCCTGLMCTDCCCECMGGDCISCC